MPMLNLVSRVAVCGILLLVTAPGFAQSDVRSVTGLVTDRRGNALPGVAVQLENSRTLAIASYITRKDGRYYFHQLNPDIDYTLTAKYKRWWSKPRTLSKFNEKPSPEIDIEVPVE